MRRTLLDASLVALLALQLGTGILRDGMVYDEVTYIPAGYRHLTASDYRLNPETPPLAKLLAALPFLWLPLRGEAPDSSDPSWLWSYHFLHVENRDRPVLQLARIPNALLSLALVVGVARCVHRVRGRDARSAALALGAFHPSLIAHGHLATTDMLQAACLWFGCWSHGRWLEAARLRHALGVGIGVGAAAATRLTGGILVLVLALVECVVLWTSTANERSQRLQRVARLALVALPVSISVLWLAYGFHYAPWPGRSVAHPPHPALGAFGEAIAALQRWRALPEAYLEALRFQLHDNLVESHDATPSWSIAYFVVLGVKNTPGFLLALGAAAIGLWRMPRARWLRGPELTWAIAAGVVLLGATAGRAQALDRYVLPIYPFSIALIACAVPALRSSRRGRAMLGAGFALHAVPCLLALPAGHIAYQSPIALAVDPAHRARLDSNLDWGQDLPRLASWMRRAGVPRVQLAYFGSDDPDRYGIEHRDLPGDHLYAPRAPKRPFRGSVAISPNLLFNLHGVPDSPYAWLRDREPDGRAGVFYIFDLGSGPDPGR
jgi:hypothetical protein